MSIGWWLQVLGGLLAVISAAMLFVGFLLSPTENIFKSVKNVFQFHFGSGDNVAGNRIIHERKFFSGTQYIRVLPPSLGGIDHLNLDNVATLKRHVPYSLEKVTLLLDIVPITLPNQHSETLAVEGTQYYNHSFGTQYTFDLVDNIRKEITVAGRSFIVTLQRVSRLDIENVPGALEYQFGISER